MRPPRPSRSIDVPTAGLPGAARPAAALLLAGALAGCSGPPAPAALAVDDEGGALLLVAGTFSRTCEEATSILFECGRWELFVHVEAAAQTPGARPLASPDVWAQSFMSDGRYDAQDCSLWGGTFEQGTIDITGVDDAVVSFTIDGTASGNFDADGSYDAVRCQGP